VWEGFTSEEAMEADEYSEDTDRSPTTAEIINAFETAFMVSGAGRMGKIVELIQTGVQVQQTIPTQTETPSSPDSLGENGVSPSTSTGVPSPTTE
jgi:hypothetical protein